MKILLAGPIETSALEPVLGDIDGLPKGMAPTPVDVLAVEYVRQGHEVSVVTLDNKIFERVRVVRPGIEVVYLPRRTRARDLALSLFSAEIAALKEEYARINPDIIHAHWTYEFAEAALRSGRPTLVTGHDCAWETLWIERDAYRFFRLLMALRTTPRIRNLSVVAPYLAPHTRYAGFLRQIRVVPNGLDLSRWPFRGENLPTSPPIIATIGNGMPRKNVHAAVSAFRLIQSRIVEAELHLFGPGLDRYAQERNVFVHGSIPNQELRNFHIQRTTILLHPSLQEICPVTLIEARALGIPVVAGRYSGGVPYVMGNSEVGLVDVKEPPAIAATVEKILSDQNLYKRLSLQGRKDVEDRFDIRQVARQYVETYDELLSPC
ncbi:glycosyltransferase family 4 protein [Bradyrhizobium sp. 24]|uniref:glycosyltransferase family 4 protein n=1 Tax=unclassified Bradyrhizobium TaxID=2631580 RepID=UPI001FFB853B|nr:MULTISPECIES: glycosyltransferase family 4 protein [unclassified Bradyrhizobium]MCK1297321.1 glycosyltransferase family 4 protein [Bradyrhizobium sp. 37]MCK1378017.1 glycosyltransferase family 4 protein [Bradyrhizobium sp. 24]MCK1769327.1 glycosyltransferase family 4 protein [Bradyrhizobium sp. 134]